MKSVVLSLVSIIVCAGLGVLISHTIVSAIGLQGAIGITVTLLLAMFLAFVFFACGAAMLKFFQSRKTDP